MKISVICVWIHFWLTVMRDAAVSRSCGGDDHGGGGGSQRLWLLRRQRFKSGDRSEGFRGVRRSCDQVGGAVRLWYSAQQRWKAFMNSVSGSRSESIGRRGCWSPAVCWRCYKESTVESVRLKRLNYCVKADEFRENILNWPVSLNNHLLNHLQSQRRPQHIVIL